MNTNVIVLGMHRSGTSAVTAAVREMGVNVGDHADLLLPQEDNRSGFWERRDCMAINDELLAATGSSWLNPTPYSARAVQATRLQDLQTRARRTIATLAAASGSWVLKDPRFCITADFWQQTFGAVVYVPVIRDPVSIARSLQVRDDLPIEFALALWETYTRAMLKQLRHQKYAPVFHAQLDQSPEDALSALHVALGQRAVTVVERLNRASVQQWRAEHVHHHAKRKELESQLSSSQLELWDYVNQLTPDAAIDADMLRDSLASLRILEQYGNAFTKLHSYRLELVALRRTEVELTKVRSAYEQLHESNTQLSEAHAAEVKRHRALEETNAVLQRDHDALAEGHAAGMERHRAPRGDQCGPPARS